MNSSNSGAAAKSGLHTFPEVAANKPRHDRVALERVVIITLNLMATAHIVWFYIDNIPTYLDLQRYEAGVERMPFQGRLLMEYPLRWAHTSPLLNQFAAWLSAMHLWLPRGVFPEDIVEFVIGFASVLIAGLVARDLYRLHSKARRLSAFVCPLVLTMVAGSYCLITTHVFRYVYDLPSLGLFACGLHLIYRRHHPLLFAALFIVATLNRETSLFLLLFFLGSSCLAADHLDWRRVLNFRVGGTAALLSVFWLAWHAWITHHFAGLPSESGFRMKENLLFLIWPLHWPQLAGVAAYTLPLLLLSAPHRSPQLRLILWIIAIWACFMFVYGTIIEIRLFGELIPVFACIAALAAEERIFTSVEQSESSEDIAEAA